MKLLKELLYSKDHEWVKVEGDKAYIGITDYAQHALGGIVFVELPEVDEEFDEGDVFGVAESVKAASDIYMPLSGKVLEVNEDLVDNPGLLNEDAFGAWVIALELTDKGQLDELLSAEEYEKFCNEEA